MARTTILDAALLVLDQAGKPLSASEIHDALVKRALYSFKAQDPISIVRAAIRKHLRTHGAAGQPPARLRLVDRDRYSAV